MINKIMALRPVAWIVSHWQLALALAGALSLALISAYLIGRSHGGNDVLVDVAQAGQKANEASTISAGQAAEEAEIESANIGRDKENADAAIRATQSANIRPSLASDALNCERLRRSGQNLDGFPACKSGAGQDGTGSRP